MANVAGEEPKRLTPTSDTVRELYLKSGNECAFPNCHERIIDENGVFVGEICHIEAALPGGERFNSSMTNEERRAFGNLILLCRKHHVVTNDVEAYPVERIKAMKGEHENRFTDVVERIRSSFVDYTEGHSTASACTGESLNLVLGWGFSPDELAGMVALVNEFFDCYARVPRSTREFASIVIERGQDHHGIGTCPVRALYYDIVEACETSEETVNKHIQILERHNVGYLDETDGVYEIVISGPDWPMWEDLRTYAKAKGFPIRELVVEGRLDLLD
jgi:hypothetical protein